MALSLWRLLLPAARGRLLGVILLGALASAADVMGLGLVAVFMARIGAGSALADSAAAAAMGLLVANGVGAWASWSSSAFAWRQEREWCARLLSCYLRMPYAWFLDRHSAALAHGALGDSLANGVLFPLLTIVRRTVSIVLVAAVLLWVDVGVAVVALAFVGTAYGLLAAATHRSTTRWGEASRTASIERFRIAVETLSAMKSVRLLHREEAMLARYDAEGARVAETSLRLAALGQLPRYVLETVAFGGIIALTLYLQAQGRAEQVLPMLSLYAMAGYRLIPAVHDVFVAITRVRFHAPVIEEYATSLSAPIPAADAGDVFPQVWDRIAVRGLRFAYGARPVLDGVDLEVARCTVVGIVGRSGAGKTTLVDLMLGLLEPASGSIEIGDVRLRPASAAAWQRRVGYAPQDVVLADDTVRANIAFGVSAGEIDEAAVVEAARVAGLLETVERDLPHGLDTVIGERGARLSAGQRQRLSLARALYTDPEVLILDEATSNLDGLTEAVVMDAIRALGGRRTLIIVAHRLATVRGCDRLYLLEDGRLSARASADEVGALLA